MQSNSSAPAPSGKPAKPYADFPLFPHATKRWAKKIKGRMHYFGPWNDPDAALKKWLAEKDDLMAGRTPRPDQDAITVRDCCNVFLTFKKDFLDSGELSPHSWVKYKTATDLLISAFGRSRLAADLRADDFAALRKRMAARWGVYRLGDMIQQVRSIFRHAHKSGLLATEPIYGPGFARPSKKVQRLHRAEQGPKLFAAEEVRRLIDAAGPSLRAMILLGINGGFGNADVGNLPLSAVNLETGWIDYPRPKTGIARRCPLWPETVAALREVLAKRPAAKCEEDAGLFFLTRCGARWAKRSEDGPVTKEMRKLLDKLGINGHRNFYALRHTFRTVADESRDQPAANFIMGHADPTMAGFYREIIIDARLSAVTDYVRRWLFPSTEFLTVAGG